MDRADVWFFDGKTNCLFIANAPYAVARSIAENLEIEFGVESWIEEV